MSKIEDLVKWKTVETVTPNYPDGVIFFFGILVVW